MARLEDDDRPTEEARDAAIIAEQILDYEREQEYQQEVLHVAMCIVASEGWWHVEGRYYGNLYDAERQRLQYAERIVRDNIRLDAWYERNAISSLNILVA